MPLDNLQELFYWVDDMDEVIGSVTREEAHNGSFKIHRTVGIFVEDEKEQILLQQRSLKKDLDPGFWTISAGGHVEFGKDYEESARIELREELGIEIPIEFISKEFVETPVQKEWVSLYKTRVSHNQQFVLDKDEVEKVQWVYKYDIAKFVQDKQFSPWAKTVCEMVGYI